MSRDKGPLGYRVPASVSMVIGATAGMMTGSWLVALVSGGGGVAASAVVAADERREARKGKKR